MIVKRFKKINIILIVFALILIIWYFSKSEKQHETHNIDHKHRIVYYEGGPYYDYVTTLISLFKGLSTIGFIEDIDLPVFEDKENTKKIWEFFCDNIKSNHIVLNKDDYYSSNWDESLRKKNKQDIYEKLNSIDKTIVIAMGTWAGLDLKNHRKNPVMVISTTDPIGSGILKDDDDFSNPNLFVEVMPDIYFKQINLFYSIFRFEKLGLVYEDSDDGRTYTAYDSVLKSARLKDFDIVNCNIDDSSPNIEEMVSQGKACIDFLSKRCDAIYLGDQVFLNYKYMPYVIMSTIDNMIPTWSHHGAEHVRRGVLMSKSYDVSFIRKGVWNAQVLSMISHGHKISNINRNWSEDTELVINLEVAKRIGFIVPESLLRITHKTFDKIEGIEVLSKDTQ